MNELTIECWHSPYVCMGFYQYSDISISDRTMPGDSKETGNIHLSITEEQHNAEFQEKMLQNFFFMENL